MTTILDQANLPPYKPRTYLPEGIDLGNIDQLKGVYVDLSERLKSVPDAEALTAWLGLYDEFTDALGEEGMKRSINYSSYSEPEIKDAYFDFVNNVTPELANPQFELMKQLRAHPAFEQLPPYYDVFRRTVKNNVDLYNEKNARILQPQETNLAAAYDEGCTEMAIDFKGEKLSPDHVKGILEQTNRADRQQAWEGVAQARLEKRKKFNQLFDEQLKIRQEMAENAGFKNYLEYMYQVKGRFEYTPEDTLALHQAVAETLVPFQRAFQEERRQQLIASGQLAPGETLKPWDLSVDPQGRPPLKPFQTGAEFIEKMTALFNAAYPGLGEPIVAAARDGLIDAENRPGKAPGLGCCYTLQEARRAFFWMNGVGIQEDLETGQHEFGHLLHAILGREQTLGAYRGEPPIEFCEVASTAMEFIGSNHLDKFYPDRSEQLRAQRHEIEESIKYVTFTASCDAFQHWIYSHPGHTHEERDAEWLKQKARFGGIEDWSGHEEALLNQWQEKVHFFSYPLYAVEYLQAETNSLEKSAQYDVDPKAAMESYIAGLKLGASKPLPELVAAAGLTFDPRGETLAGSIATLTEKFDGIRAAEKALETPAPRRDLGVELNRVVPAVSVEAEQQKSIV